MTDVEIATAHLRSVKDIVVALLLLLIEEEEEEEEDEVLSAVPASEEVVTNGVKEDDERVMFVCCDDASARVSTTFSCLEELDAAPPISPTLGESGSRGKQSRPPHGRTSIESGSMRF